MTLTRSALNNWINGNMSSLDKHDLIGIARYFEDKSKNRETDIMEDIEEDE